MAVYKGMTLSSVFGHKWHHAMSTPQLEVNPEILEQEMNVQVFDVFSSFSCWESSDAVREVLVC